MHNEVVEEKTNVKEETMTSWSQSDKDNSRSKYGCEILVENGSQEQMKTKEAPNDARIVTYVVNGETRYDLTRSQKAVNIFDMYYDKFGMGSIKDIAYGHGTINPKLWGYKAPETKKRK